MAVITITRPGLPGDPGGLLEAAGHEIICNPHDAPMARELLLEAAAKSDGMLCLLSDRIDGDLLDAAPRCRVYANHAVGHDNMDMAAATAAGVALCNTPDVLTDATADMAWALLMSAARRIAEADAMVRRGEFPPWNPRLLLGCDVAGKTMGIIGAGRIGGAVGRRAVGFGMTILYTRRSGPSAELDALGGRHVDLVALLRESDFVSIHTPLTDETRHLIGARELALMKPTTVLVNTARGPVVDEAALVEALRAGTIAAAGLDVYEDEPRVHPGLLELTNTVLAPHIGSATPGARVGMGQLAARNLLDFFEGRVPRACINPGYVDYRAK